MCPRTCPSRSACRASAQRTAHSPRKHRDIRMLRRFGRHAPRLDPAEVESLFAMPFVELLFTRSASSSASRAEHRADEHAAVDQDRCMPRGLRVLPAERRYDTGLERETLLTSPRSARPRERAKDAGATRFCMGAAYRSPKPKQVTAIAEDDSRGARARHGNLRHARHAHARARPLSCATPVSTTTTTISTPRRVLRRDHHDAHISRTASTRSKRCATRHEGMLRRNRRHG
jgi:hypothetical protein